MCFLREIVPLSFAELLNNYLMNVVLRRNYFLLASLNYLMKLFPGKSYFLLALLIYLMNLFPRRSYFLLASLNHLMNFSPSPLQKLGTPVSGSLRRFEFLTKNAPLLKSSELLCLGASGGSNF